MIRMRNKQQQIPDNYVRIVGLKAHQIEKRNYSCE